MSNAVTEINKRLPLDDLHRELGATFVERDGWSIPLSYGDTKAEYAVVREGGAGLIDLSHRGRIKVTGTEAVQFLNGLITNDVKTLEVGAWMAAAFPNVQGRLLASARVLHREGEFLFDTEGVTSANVSKHLSRFVPAGDFHVTDVSAEMLCLSIQGAGAPEIVTAVLGTAAGLVEPWRTLDVPFAAGIAAVIRATHTAEDGFDVFVDSGDASALMSALIDAGARPVGEEVIETLRIEAGIPRFGVDVSESNVVLEAGQDDEVSFTKGCYVGQEIIARIHFRGHVAKRLAGVTIDGSEQADVGNTLHANDGKEVGRITSGTYSPVLGQHVCLAIVKYDFLATDTLLFVRRDGAEIPAKVSGVPFVRGSWKAATHSSVESPA